MKKSIFLLAAGAIALTACTQSEVVEEGVQSNAIGFQHLIGKETRGLTSGTEGNFKMFNVYAYYTDVSSSGSPVSVFTGEDVELNGKNWTYKNTRYWVPDATYYFYAYSCENKEVNASYGTPSMNLSGANENARALRLNDFVCNNTHQHDLIYATNEGTVGLKEGNSKVGLSFNHILTKVDVEFTSGFVPGYTVKVSDVQIRNIRDKGSYNPKATNVWGEPQRVLKNEDDTYEPYIQLAIADDNAVASAKDGNTPESKVKTQEGYVIPFLYQNADVYLRFRVEVTNKNGVEILDQYLSGYWDPKWVSGNYYTYKVQISGDNTVLEPIVFETSDNMNVVNWNSVTAEVNMNFNVSTPDTPAN